MVQRLLSSNRYLFSIASSFFFLEFQNRPKIADYFGALLNQFGGEEAESGAGAAQTRYGLFDEIAGMTIE